MLRVDRLANVYEGKKHTMVVSHYKKWFPVAENIILDSFNEAVFPEK